MNQDWNVDNYSNDFSFVHNYGNDVLELIDPKNVEKVLDLGCGTGALTNTLSKKGYSVIGLDGSPEMVKAAKNNYPDLEFILSDATDFLLKEKVDAVFSNAVFHWIDKKDQLKMMKCVYDSLKSGGQFVFEMGGYGNNKLIHAALLKSFNKAGYNYVIPFYFPSIGEYATLLEKAGFLVTYAILFDRPTPLKGSDGLSDWIRMFIGNPFKSVNENDREIIIQDTVKALKPDLYKDGVWYSDYVRLRMKAIKK